MGDDDSGPVDLKDDVDLECEKVKMILIKFVFTFEEPTYCNCLMVSENLTKFLATFCYPDKVTIYVNFSISGRCLQNQRRSIRRYLVPKMVKNGPKPEPSFLIRVRIELLSNDKTEKEIPRQYPTLRKEDIKASLIYPSKCFESKLTNT